MPVGRMRDGHHQFAQLLRDDPRLESVVVAPAAGGAAPTLRVRARRSWLEAKSARTGEALALRSEQQWRSTYDKTYAGVATGPSYAGWVSSYTRAALPEAVMSAWRDACCARMLALPHRHVLEIGCGAGLILERVAPQCESYHGVDLSGQAIAGLRGWLETRPDLSHVSLEAAPARPGMALPERPFDLVVLNSMVQYLPSAEALAELVAALWPRLGPHGHVFIGDVRPHRLNATFLATVAVARARPGARVFEILEERDAAIQAHAELTLDPAFFHRLTSRLGGAVRIEIKTTRDESEMTAYRYDVVLGRTPPAAPPRTEQLDAAALAARLRAGDGRPAVARNVPRTRLLRDRAVAKALSEASPDMTLDDLLAGLPAPVPAVTSESLLDLAQKSALPLTLGLAPDGGDGLCEAWVGAGDTRPRPATPAPAGHPDHAAPMEAVALRMLVLDLFDRIDEAAAAPPGLRILAEG